jgi:hypothetical protein
MTQEIYPTTRRLLASGAAAGAASAFAFTALHHLLISNIWFALIPMLVAGAVSGLSLAWTYGLLFESRTAAGWWLYNALWVLLLALLGVASLVVFEPVTTMAAVMALNGPPDELIRQAMPLSVGFTLGWAALLSALWGRTPLKAFSILVTTAILVFLLGLNVSTLGLVELAGGGLWLVAEMLGLIMTLLFGFAGIFLLLERRRFDPGRTGAAGVPDRPERHPRVGAERGD